ncbi:MAG TPA: glycosyltransferase family 1 protein [Candidatus Deferrimicrobiaceae bacterium]
MDFRRTGIGRVFENILSGLLASDGVASVQVVIPESRREPFERDYGNRPKLRVAYAAFEPFSLGDFFSKQRLFDRFPEKADLAFYPNMNVPLIPRGRFAFTVNDIIMMTGASSWSPIKKWLFRVLTARALARADGLVCISEATRRDVERVFGRIPCPVKVIHPAVGDDFQGVDPARYRESPLVSGDYLFHVGIRVGHKNHAGLIRGWLEARKAFPGLKLVIAGKRLWEDDVDRLRAEEGLGDELVEMRGATDDEVKNLMANARAFVFPSLAEGFGIPPLEAMAMGAPVVCADIPVLREVNRDAAVYVDPHDPASIGRGIVSVLSDAALRERLAAAAKALLPHYAKDRMTGDYLSFLRTVAR